MSFFSIALLVFAAAFFVGGLLRIVEFLDVGLGKLVRACLITAHVIGVALFSSVFALLAIDVHERHKSLMSYLLFSGLGILLPLHIFLALKRRIRIRDQGR